LEGNPNNHVYIVDSGASVHIFNQNPYKNFEFSSSQSVVEGISKEKIVALGEEDNLYIGRYLIIPQCSTNLLSVSELVKKGIQITFDGDSAFLRTAKNTYFLKHSADGLYYIRKCQLDNMIEDQMDMMKQDYAYKLTIASEDHSYTPKQRMKAGEMHRLHYSLGHPSNQSMKNMLKYGLVINTDLVPGDVDLYASIYGPCPHCIEGKVNAPTYISLTSETMNIIGERIHMDIKPMKEVQVDGGHAYMLISVDQFSGYLHAVPCKTKLKDDVFIAFKEIVGWYKSFDHPVKQVMCDSEQTFKSLETDIRLMQIQPLFTTPYQHAQRIERYIQTINQRMSTILASLPYVLPHRLY
jgi:hypothetical protein